MSKTKKRILGFLGLSFVLAATVFAATLPSPDASATSSLSDTLVVRVVGAVPDVKITGIVNGKVYANPNRPFSVSYENVNHLTVTLDYTDLEGNVITKLLDEQYPEYPIGEFDYNIKLINTQ